MLSGRLGLEAAGIPHTDRHGVMWLSRGRLEVHSGTLVFIAAGGGELEAGRYDVPYQSVSSFVLGPGTSWTHDVLRLCCRHGTGIVAVGDGGVRMYGSLVAAPDRSRRARSQARLWADPLARVAVARRMYAWRLGEVLPTAEISVLRGMEGARMKETYRALAQQAGISWRGRRYDRDNPEGADIPNQALNHMATAAYAASQVAVRVSGAIDQLGFIHEDSGHAFSLDIADLFRDSFTVPLAFAAAAQHGRNSSEPLERHVRRLAGSAIRRDKIVATMIDRIKEILDADDHCRDT